MGGAGGGMSGSLNPLNAKVMAIVRREYLQRVRSKWFLLATFGIPLLMVGLGAMSGFLITRGGEETLTFSTGVVDRSGEVSQLVVAELLRDSLLASEAVGVAAFPDDSLPGRLVASDFDVFLVIPPELGLEVTDQPGVGGEYEEGPELELVARMNVNSGTRRTIRVAVNRALVKARLERAGVEGLDPEALLRGSSLSVVNVTEQGEARSQEVFQAISFIISFLFYMVLIFYGQMIVRSVIEEKSSNIVEVMMSSLRPWELMLGKIVGVGAVGLTQLAIWAAVVATGILYGLTAGAAALSEAGVDLSQLTIPVSTIILVLTFLVLGYLLYSGLFAGAGATVSNEHDAQQALFPVIILIVIPFVAAQGIIENPNTGWAIILSLVPFFSPLIMSSRLFVAVVPAWQLAVALVLLLLFIFLAAWVAGRIYRVGILMKGKRPNLPELVRWVRHG
jgi:ABC-2 type transport system permease protein